MEEILTKLLEFADKQTDWKENNDTTNSQVVQEFINRNERLVKLFSIPDVIESVCPTCKVELDKMDSGQLFCPKCLKLYKQTCL